MSARPGPTRRALLLGSLGGAVVGLSAACTDAPGIGGGRRTSAAPDPDTALREAAISRERALLTAYDAALSAAPAGRRLAGLRAEHAQHLAALSRGLPPTTATPAGPTPAGPTPAGPTPAGSAAAGPATAEPATTSGPAGGPPPDRAALIAMERTASTAHGAAAVAARDGAFAAVLASLAASEASHPVALG